MQVKSSFVATPLAAVAALVSLNTIGILGTDFNYIFLLWLHVGGLTLGLMLAWLFRTRRALRSASISLPKVLTAESGLAITSVLMILFLLARAGVDPLTYILNLNHYRLAVNRDVGYAKFILNLWAVVGVVAYFRRGGGFGRFILLPGLANVFWGFRFCFVFALFSLLFAALSRAPLRMRHIAAGLFAFFLFGGFAIWRDFAYQQITIADVAAFIFDLSDSGLATALLAHGFSEHFVAIRYMSDAIAFSESGLYAPHYGLEYLTQIIRLIHLGNIFGAGFSVDVQFNAFLGGRAPSDLADFDAGGVVIGLPGSLIIAGGTTALIIGSMFWGWLCAYTIRRIQQGAQPLYLAMLPYVLVIYQSPETNISRNVVILAAYYFVLIAAGYVRSLVQPTRPTNNSIHTQASTHGIQN
jgi:hypothetical protein